MKTIQGKFMQFEVGNGKLSTFISEMNEYKIYIQSLTQEDGSGHRFLINHNTDLQRGYIDFKSGTATITIQSK